MDASDEGRLLLLPVEPVLAIAQTAGEESFVKEYSHSALFFEQAPDERGGAASREIDNPVRALVVDAPDSCAIVRRALGPDMVVHEVNDAAAALEVLDRVDPEIIISDQRIGEMTGIELLATVADRRPDCIRVLLTAVAEYDTLLRAINIGRIHHYEEKPIQPIAFRAAILALVRREGLRRGSQPEVSQLRVVFLSKEGPYTFVDDQISVGRSTTNDIVLQDLSVSGTHAQLSVTDAGVWISDLGSSNGTLVNDRPLAKHYPERLQDGDRLRLGTVACEFHDPRGVYRYLRQIG